MPSNFFTEIIANSNSAENNASVAFLDLRENKKILIVSDLHMGCGKRDDLTQNGSLLISMLENYYFPQGWYLALNGDVEELYRYSLSAIQKNWQPLYRIFNLFAGENRLYKTLGNHDEDLASEKNYPYPLYRALRIETKPLPLFVYHGHQASDFYTKHSALTRAFVRYFLTPFGIKNISAARNPHRRFFVEKMAYTFSMENNCVSIIGHTHRTLFESLGRFDYIKFEIERLCRDYPATENKEEKARIAAEVTALRTELGKLKRSERRDVLRQSIYGDELPVPCLFNSGSAISRHGINALELTNESIALVYWFKEGEGRKFVSRGGYRIEPLLIFPTEPDHFTKWSGEGSPLDTNYRRVVLNHDKLDYIKTRMELLGPVRQ